MVRHHAKAFSAFSASGLSVILFDVDVFWRSPARELVSHMFVRRQIRQKLRNARILRRQCRRELPHDGELRVLETLRQQLFRAVFIDHWTSVNETSSQHVLLIQTQCFVSGSFDVHRRAEGKADVCIVQSSEACSNFFIGCSRTGSSSGCRCRRRRRSSIRKQRLRVMYRDLFG